jgi:hypothetical protein
LFIYQRRWSLSPGRPKAGRAALSLYEILVWDLHDIGGHARLENELSDPVARPNNERLSTVEVLKNNLNLTLIIRVNDSCQSVQTVLYGKSRARRNTSISSRGELDANTGRDNDSMARKDDIVVNAE